MTDLCWMHYKEESGFSANATYSGWIEMLNDNDFTGPDWPRKFKPRRECRLCNPEGHEQATLPLSR